MAEKEIKAVFFDIDGTLYSHLDHYYSASSLAAIQKMHDAGKRLALCTGRGYSELGGVPKEILDLPFDAVIVSAGGVIYAQDAIVFAKTFDAGDTQKIHAVCSERQILYYFIDEQGSGMIPIDDQEILDTIVSFEGGLPPVRAMGEHVQQMLLFLPPALDQEVHSALPQLEYHRSSLACVDLYPLGVHKLDGIQRVLKDWGIDASQAMAFGDSFNDREMLQGVGLGIAMGNAPQHVKDIADDVCDSLFEDGIYKACQKYGLL